ncbi:MAG: aminotransferase class I/II-fold pyridoxal phosphate-dependent enzyme [Calditrichia bacterium]|nr:aminotransferase class I/II-fold pyridoxal phosphate-dependent enzyme [Calditrichia bacterium]
MNIHKKFGGGENFNLRDILMNGKQLSFSNRINTFSHFISELTANQHNLYMRQITSAADREVEIADPFTKRKKRMLMFGSNNYLGLANHPYVREQVKKAIDKFGVGIGGPPLLNGYTNLYRELEEKLASLKHAEDSLLFSSGYAANVGLISALINHGDKVLYDAYSHASFCDGLRMAKAEAILFKHNDMKELETLLDQNNNSYGDIFVGVEGVYSMDGDLAPLDKVALLCKKNNSILIVDDAHGTGVMGETGSGTAEHFEVDELVDITMGTFSKTFGVCGGFISASKPIINYLRFFARSHMFSASLPPVIITSVLAGLKVIKNQLELIKTLNENIKYTSKGLKKLGFNINPQSAIIALRVPETMNIREAAYHFHKAGIFVNSIEYPAVPVNQQRFRISLMATHTKEDINKLLTIIEEVWILFNREIKLKAS